MTKFTVLEWKGQKVVVDDPNHHMYEGWHVYGVIEAKSLEDARHMLLQGVKRKGR